MNTKKILVATTFALLTVSTAAAAPSFPDLFYGDLTINGGDSPSGTKIVTKVDGTFSGNITTDQPGAYGYSDSKKKQLAVSSDTTGKEVKFFVKTADGSLSSPDSQSQTVDYRAKGDIRKVDLTFNDVNLVTASAGGSYSVKASNSVSLKGSSSGFDSPQYSWSIKEDPTGEAKLSSKGSSTASFEAPDSVESEEEVKVKLTVSSSKNSKKASDTAKITVKKKESGEEAGGGTGSGSGTSGGQEETPEPKQVQADVEGEKATAQVTDVQENQKVEVEIPDTPEQKSKVEKVSFTSRTSADSVEVSVSDLGSDRPDDVDEDAGTDVYSYQEINVEGVEDQDIEQATINFKVEKSFLEEKNKQPENVVMKRYNDQNWQELDTSMTEELDDAYRFEAESLGFSYYAIALEEDVDTETDVESSIGVSSISATPESGSPPFNVTFNVEVTNTGGAEGEKTVKVSLGEEVVHEEQVQLGAGESTTFSFSYMVEDSGTFTFSADGTTTVVTSEKKSQGVLPPVVGLLVLALLAAAAFYKRESILEEIEDLRR